MDASSSSLNVKSQATVPDASKEATKKPFNLNAQVFVPTTPKAFVQLSSRYFGNKGHFASIKEHFENLLWSADVKTVYVTNGWHAGFEGGGTVIYCGYCVNEDSEHGKLHYYFDHWQSSELIPVLQKLGLL